MKQPLYTKLLSKEERADCMVTGMMLKGASANIPFEQIKQAGLSDIGDMSTKAVLATSLLTGIPTGIIAHLLHKRMKAQSLQESEALEKIDYYRDAADLVEDEMAKNQISY